jgi:DNA topoisomerase IA
MMEKDIVIFQSEGFRAQALLLWSREVEIRKHVLEPYWTISGEFEKNGHIIKAHNYQQKISSLPR